MQRKQDAAATEQGKGGENKAAKKVPGPMRICFQPEIAKRSQMKRTNQRPKQNNRGNQQRAMEKTFKIEFGKTRKQPVLHQPLRPPIKNGCQQRTQNEGCGKINE